MARIEPINFRIVIDNKTSHTGKITFGKKDRYFTDGTTIAKNPRIENNEIHFDSHTCLNVYSRGGWLPITEYTLNWSKCSKKQRKEFKRIELSHNNTNELLNAIESDQFPVNEEFNGKTIINDEIVDVIFTFQKKCNEK